MSYVTNSKQLARQLARKVVLFRRTRLAALRNGAATATGKPGRFYLEHRGFCTTCDSNVIFFADNEWLRDNFLCPRCGSIPRERALMLCIERFFPDWKSFFVHESSPGQRGASVKLKKHCSNYIGTHYFPDFPAGEKHPTGWRNENLEDQTFPGEAFDLIVSQDVMEHLLNPAKAFTEIARTLKPGGAHVFTVPIVRRAKQSRVRARLNKAGEIEYLLPAEYHGNPIDASGSLVTVDWGYDICEFIHRHTGLHTTMVYLDDLEHGIRAEFIEVLISRKLPGWKPVVV